jgi:hypothetical protein
MRRRAALGVRRSAYLSGLPKRYEPVVRSRLRSYEDGFFRQLGKPARPAPLTELAVGQDSARDG